MVVVIIEVVGPGTYFRIGRARPLIKLPKHINAQVQILRGV